MKKLISLILVTIFLTSCTLSFKLKGFVYGHSIRQMEADYLKEAKAALGEKPAVNVYTSGLKKYNRIKDAREVKISEEEAEFQVDKTMLQPQFAKMFLDFLVQQSIDKPQQKPEDVLNAFLAQNPEPWPTESFTVRLILKKSGDLWDVASETRL
ncbi:MAG: hypothetical protein ACLGGX_10665 [Bdellovibrionia bacterium]